jgi:lactate permease
MDWIQDIDPFNRIALSALAAAVPIIFIFWALIIKKMKGYMASLLTLLVAVIVSFFPYGMPVSLSLLSALHGFLYGLFPICWIILGAVYLYNLTVASGQFETIKSSLASITDDRRLQALLIAFSFGAFLEGTTGMGAPVAISAAILAGLGFNPLYAAGICLIANTAPVAFGAVGTPIIVANQVTGIPEMAVSQMVGRTLPFLSVIIPFYLVVIMSGFRKSLEVFPAILVSGVTFAFFQWLISNYVSYMLPDIIAGLASIACLVILMRFWKPKSIWHFKDEPPPSPESKIKHSPGQILRAWSPFILMTIVIIAWGLQPVKNTLNHIGLIRFDIPGLQNSITRPDGSPLIIKPFDLNYLSSSGTALLLSALLSLPLIGVSLKKAAGVFMATLNQLKYTFITVASVLGFAFVANNSGMSITLAMALASTGVLFPFFSPVLGWLGVFLTGSDASSNALFSKLQAASAEAIGVDPVLTVAANASGGVMGKMISPQSIAVGTAAAGLIGKESDLFRFTLKHSILMLFVVCLITLIQAYVVSWIIPVYKLSDSSLTAASPDPYVGAVSLLVLAMIIALIYLAIYLTDKKKKVV